MLERTALTEIRWQRGRARCASTPMAWKSKSRRRDGPYSADGRLADAADGCRSAIRPMLGLDITGEIFQDHFLIADIRMQAALPDGALVLVRPAVPPRPVGAAAPAAGRRLAASISSSAGTPIPTARRSRERVMPRGCARMLGEDVAFELEWVSVYTFPCRRMERFVHGRVIFAGDAAQCVSPFGARGANGGVQDADNLCLEARAGAQGRSRRRRCSTAMTHERVHAARREHPATRRAAPTSSRRRAR